MDASSRQALEDFVAATHVKHNAMIGPSNPRLGSKMSISDASLHQSSMDLDKTARAIAIREHDIPLRPGTTTSMLQTRQQDAQVDTLINIFDTQQKWRSKLIVIGKKLCALVKMHGTCQSARQRSKTYAALKLLSTSTTKLLLADPRPNFTSMPRTQQQILMLTRDIIATSDDNMLLAHCKELIAFAKRQLRSPLPRLLQMLVWTQIWIAEHAVESHWRLATLSWERGETILTLLNVANTFGETTTWAPATSRNIQATVQDGAAIQVKRTFLDTLRQTRKQRLCTESTVVQNAVYKHGALDYLCIPTLGVEEMTMMARDHISSDLAIMGEHDFTRWAQSTGSSKQLQYLRPHITLRDVTQSTWPAKAEQPSSLHGDLDAHLFKLHGIGVKLRFYRCVRDYLTSRKETPSRTDSSTVICSCTGFGPSQNRDCDAHHANPVTAEMILQGQIDALAIDTTQYSPETQVCLCNDKFSCEATF